MARNSGRFSLEEGKKKKLIEAGAYLATPRTSQDDIDKIREELESYNADQDYIDHELSQHQQAPFELYPDYIRALRLFSMLDTQWRLDPAGQRAGLDYPSIEIVLNLQGINHPRKRKILFEQIQLIERGYLKKREELRG